MVDVDVRSTRLQTVLLEIQKEKETRKIELTKNKLGFSVDWSYSGYLGLFERC